MSDNTTHKSNTAGAAANLDVLLLAVSMAAPSPRRSTKSAENNIMTRTVAHSSISAPSLTAGSLWQRTNHFSAAPPLVTPPTVVELLDGHPANMPILQHTAPPQMKVSHYGPFTTSSLPEPKMRINHPRMFATNSLPIKKRFKRDGGSILPPPIGTLCDGSTAIQSSDRCCDRVATMTQAAAPTPPPSGSSNTTAVMKKSSTEKKYRKPSCSHPSCTNRVMNRGVCARHGARVRICSIPECSKYAQKGGVCIRHGAKKEYKRCSVEGCNSRAAGSSGRNGVSGRSVCSRHASTLCVEFPREARQDVNGDVKRTDEEHQRETL